MRIGDRQYSREEILRRVGNAAQIGGTRHYVLSEGRAKGVAAIDFDTGSGLRFTVLPDRGMDISSATFRGTNLVYLTPNGEAGAAYYEPQGLGWLRTFFGGLLTTCGLNHFGAPGRDGDEELGLHGRHATTPAAHVRDDSRWVGDEYVLEASGVCEDAVLFGDRLRLTRTVSARIGENRLQICDVVENFGYRPSPFTILYHINLGFPLLDASSRVQIGAAYSAPHDAVSAQDMERMFECSAPVPGYREQNFTHRMAADAEGDAYAALVNPRLHGGLGVYVRFDARTLPWLNEWKMLGEGDYVLAIEPCNAPAQTRAVLRQDGTLPFLAPGETREMRLEIGVLEGAADLDAVASRIAAPTPTAPA